MSPEIVGLLGIILLLFLMACRMWIGAAMAITGFLGIAYIRGFDQAFLAVISQSFRNIAFAPISVLPMFLFMGNIIFEMGLGADIYNCAYKWIGHVKGGLAIATVFACALFGAITGVNTPILATMAKTALPEMRKHGYDDALSSGCIVSAAGLDPLIPPSLSMVMYGVLTSQSIGKLFIAGILPAVVLGILYIIVIRIIVKVRPGAGPAGPKTSFKEKIVSLKYTWPALILFLLVIGGIYGGIFTPTEAGAVGAFGSLVIVIIMRRFTFEAFIRALTDTALMTSMILLIIAGAFIFMHFICVSRLPIWMSSLITGINAPPMVIFVLLILIYLFLGTAIDILPVIMLTIPIVCPIMQSLGFDLIWFGVIILLVMEMGMLSPPDGIDVYVFSGLTGIPITTVFRGSIPFLIAVIVCIIILAIFPQIALFLPNRMG